MTHTTTKPEEKRWVKANALSPAFNWEGKIRWYDITNRLHEDEDGNFTKVRQLQLINSHDLRVEWEESIPPLSGEKESKLEYELYCITKPYAVDIPEMNAKISALFRSKLKAEAEKAWDAGAAFEWFEVDPENKPERKNTPNKKTFLSQYDKP